MLTLLLHPCGHPLANFRTVVLRRGGMLLSVATLRVLGPRFAELPYVATKEDMRRRGYCRTMVQAVETHLKNFGVQFLVVPSVKSVLPMWCEKFQYERLSEAEYEAIQKDILDVEGSIFVKKQLISPLPEADPVLKVHVC